MANVRRNRMEVAVHVREALELIQTVECFPGWSVVANPATDASFILVYIDYHTIDSDTLEVKRFKSEAVKIAIHDVDKEGLLRRIIDELLRIRVHEEREFFQAVLNGKRVKFFDPHSEMGEKNWTRTACVLS
jgi:hypothetical protein